MIDRCYNPECKEYKYYGLVGVYTEDKWHEFNGFLEDIELIDGWDLEKYKNRELVLDKDIKFEGNKLYSKETCKWVTREDNLKNIPSRMHKILGVDPKGKEYIFYNQTEFAKNHGLIQAHISSVVRGERKHHKNWTFRTLKKNTLQPVKNPKRLYTKHYVAYKEGQEIGYGRVKNKLLRELNIPVTDTNLAKMEDGRDCYGIVFKKEKRERFKYD